MRSNSPINARNDFIDCRSSFVCSSEFHFGESEKTGWVSGHGVWVIFARKLSAVNVTDVIQIARQYTSLRSIGSPTCKVHKRRQEMILCRYSGVVRAVRSLWSLKSAGLRSGSPHYGNWNVIAITRAGEGSGYARRNVHDLPAVWRISIGNSESWRCSNTECVYRCHVDGGLNAGQLCDIHARLVFRVVFVLQRSRPAVPDVYVVFKGLLNL